MEHGIPQPPAPAQLGHEAEGQQGRPGALDGGGAPEDIAQEDVDVAETLRADALQHKVPLAQADLPPQQHGGHQHHGHIAQPPHLDEHQQDELAQAVELGPGVLRHQPGDAGGGGGGEQAVQEGQGAACPVGEGQGQQQCPGQDDAEEARGQNAAGGEQGGFFLQRARPPFPGRFVLPIIPAGAAVCKGGGAEWGNGREMQESGASLRGKNVIQYHNNARRGGWPGAGPPKPVNRLTSCTAACKDACSGGVQQGRGTMDPARV